MFVLSLPRCRRPSAEVEVAALVGLQNTFEVKTTVSAMFLGEVGRRLPFFGPALQLVLIHQELETALGNIQPDLIAIPHETQGATSCRLRSNVKNDRPKGS